MNGFYNSQFYDILSAQETIHVFYLLWLLRIHSCFFTNPYRWGLNTPGFTPSLCLVILYQFYDCKYNYLELYTLFHHSNRKQFTSLPISSLVTKITGPPSIFSVSTWNNLLPSLTVRFLSNTAICFPLIKISPLFHITIPFLIIQQFASRET